MDGADEKNKSRKTREFSPQKSLTRGPGREVRGPVKKNETRKTRISANFSDRFLFGRQNLRPEKSLFKISSYVVGGPFTLFARARRGRGRDDTQSDRTLACVDV